MIDYMEIGKRIRRFRQERGITQEELAYEIDSSAAYISNIERGIKKPSLQKLFDIADIFQITLNDLIYEKPDILPEATQQTLRTLRSVEKRYKGWGLQL